MNLRAGQKREHYAEPGACGQTSRAFLAPISGSREGGCRPGSDVGALGTTSGVYFLVLALFCARAPSATVLAQAPCHPSSMPTRHSEKILLRPGSLLAGRYRIDRVLGRGGFAQVFLGRHAEIDSLQVAVKVLHAAHQDREVIVSRFRREARLLALLRNRHTVRLVDFGFTDEGVGYLVMEYVRGAALDRWLKDNGPMRPTDVARLAVGTLKALDEAHSIGVIHRDLKPANILLVNEPGEHHALARVLDFGIAKVMGVADAAGEAVGESDAIASRGDMVFCTPLYAAPELLRGKPDFRTDIYALGLIMAELLDGHPPYSPDACALANSPHLERTPVPLGAATLESGLADVIRRACAKRLSERYASAVEMLAELEIAYERLKLPDYQEAPLRIVPSAPVTTERPLPCGAARSSQFIEVSALQGEPFESIRSFRLSEVAEPDDEPFAEVVRPLQDVLGEVAVIGVRAKPAAAAASEPVQAQPTSEPSWRWGRWVVALLLILGLVLVLFWRPRPTEPPPVDVASSEVETEPIGRSASEVSAAFARASAEFSGAVGAALSSCLVVNSDHPAQVRIDGLPVGEVTPSAPYVGRAPMRRPFTVELVAPGIVYSQPVVSDGLTSLDVAIAASAIAAEDAGTTLPTEQAVEAERTPRRRSSSARRNRNVPSPADEGAGDTGSLLGPPIRPRTQ
ncbi:MAG: serine/threonine protein kinase [Bradymonadia bacterium]|jgi:serine/threonine protein kinase